MTDTERKLLEALRCAIRGEKLPWTPQTEAAMPGLLRLAQAQVVLPLVVETLQSDTTPETAKGTVTAFGREAKRQTLGQAQRTGDFLLLYRELERRGLRPMVMKGIVLRTMYPQPEQRPSVDEDLWIRPEELTAYHTALTELGLTTKEPPMPGQLPEEVTYVDPARGLYLELHLRLFPGETEACRGLDRLFEGAWDRTSTLEYAGQTLLMPSPTDHLLFMICHAYKHFLFGGVGIRQICDLALFGKVWRDQIQWERLRDACDGESIALFAGALFQIGAQYLGLEAPAVFRDAQPDLEPLLEDVLSGGLYGMNDINRAHSSHITLEAVAAARQGKRRKGFLAAVFLPRKSLAGRYPWLNSCPWLLPWAWVLRVGTYLLRRDPRGASNPSAVDPTATIRIGAQRVALLRQYGILQP